MQETTLYDKALACLLGGLIGDAMGTPTEGRDYRWIEQRYGWVDDFIGEGTDDTVMKNLLAEALIRTDGYATLDDWAQVWLDNWEAIFGPKVGKFFIAVLNAAHKLRHGVLPRMAALGNLPSSSSAMGIAPVGIVNACNPRQAAQQAYNLAGLIHTYDVAFCQDGAACISAAVAAAFIPGADVATVLEAAQEAILPLSGAELRGRIDAVLALARAEGEYKAFRAAAYADPERTFCRILCDSRETVPLALALFYLAEGDVARTVRYTANFGRDADTLGAMAGGIAGALQGMAGIPPAWADKAQQATATDQSALAERLAQVARTKLEREKAAQRALEGLL